MGSGVRTAQPDDDADDTTVPADPDWPTHDQYVALKGLKLFVREEGSGHPLLLVNGLGANVEMWGPARAQLAEGSHTIAFDAPGTGRSRTCPAVLPHPGYARMICALLDRLGIERVDVLGYSFGGTVAQQLARSAPDRVRRMALVGTSCGWGSIPGDGRSLALIMTPLRYYSRFFFEHTSWLLDGVDRLDRPALDEHADARLRFPPTVRGYASQVVAGSTWSSLHWLHTLNTPTLVLAGERDRLVPPANGVLLAHRLKNSRLHIVPGEGHLMLFDPASGALPTIAEFFAAADHEGTAAWKQGVGVNQDSTLHDAMSHSVGMQPYKAMGGIYRWWVSNVGAAVLGRR